MNLIEELKKSLPRYITEQPSTKAKLKFRPFTVKEEKVLLMANQTGNFEDFLVTLSDIIDSCFELKGKSKDLPFFDIDHLFLALRSKSIGEIVEPKFICPETGETIQVTLNLDEVKPIYSKDHSREISINETMVVKMKYPSLDYMIHNKSDYYDMVIDSIESVETKDQLLNASETSRETLKEFVDLLTQQQFKKLVNFFKTMPKIEQEVNYITSDGVSRKITLKGIRDFFR